MSDPNLEPIVYLHRYGQQVEIEGDVPKSIENDFPTVRYEPNYDAGVITMRRRLGTMFKHELGKLRCFAGVAELVIEYLQRLGYRVVDRGRHEYVQLSELPEPRDVKNIVGDPVDAKFVDFVRRHERGFIHLGPGVSVARLMCQVAAAWPKSRIVCVVTRRSDAKRLETEMREWRGGPTLLAIGSSSGYSPARFVIGTYRCLGIGEADLHHADFVFVLNPSELPRNSRHAPVIRDAVRARLFAISPSNFRMTEEERLDCLELYGTSSLVIPYHGQVQRPVQVAFVPFKSGYQHQHGDSKTEVLRCLVWKHHWRNKRVAELAKAVAGGSFHLKVGGALYQRRFEYLCKRQSGGRVGVLVANLEQAAELCHRLRNWRLITGESMRTIGLSTKAARRLLDAADTEDIASEGVIVTQAGLQYVTPLDVLIRADAGTDTITTRWLNYSQLCVTPPPGLVIDINDRHHRVLRRRNGMRKQAYLKAGWRLPLDYPIELYQLAASWPRTGGTN